MHFHPGQAAPCPYPPTSRSVGGAPATVQILRQRFNAEICGFIGNSYERGGPRALRTRLARKLDQLRRAIIRNLRGPSRGRIHRTVGGDFRIRLRPSRPENIINSSTGQVGPVDEKKNSQPIRGDIVELLATRSSPTRKYLSLGAAAPAFITFAAKYSVPCFHS